MAITDMLKSITPWNKTPVNPTLAQNYRSYGAELGLAGYDEFIERANRFYDKANAACKERKEGYTRIELGKKRVAFDYNCELRGIYSASGKTMAFYKPNYKAAGFRTAQEELESFKRTEPMLRS